MKVFKFKKIKEQGNCLSLGMFKGYEGLTHSLANAIDDISNGAKRSKFKLVDKGRIRLVHSESLVVFMGVKVEAYSVHVDGVFLDEVYICSEFCEKLGLTKEMYFKML